MKISEAIVCRNRPILKGGIVDIRLTSKRLGPWKTLSLENFSLNCSVCMCLCHSMCFETHAPLILLHLFQDEAWLKLSLLRQREKRQRTLYPILKVLSMSWALTWRCWRLWQRQACYEKMWIAKFLISLRIAMWEPATFDPWSIMYWEVLWCVPSSKRMGTKMSVGGEWDDHHILRT